MNARLAHLDGLRALSVALVFLFHAEVAGATGGFLGVSVFFTLSGYLLTYRLLTVEPTWSSARSYWASRWRRILPAALAVMILVVSYETVTSEATGGARRIWFTALGLANWLQIIDGTSYADLFASPDKLVHYWSLGVEEQVYLLLPVVLFVCLRRSRRTAGLVLAVLAATSFALPTLFGMSLTRSYYGTDTRVGEILVGSLLALVHAAAGHEPSLQRRRWPSWVGVGGLAVLVAASFTVTATSDVIRTGLLPLVALSSVAALHGARHDPRFLGGLFETRPMVWVGRLSYPIYLVHWPVLVILADRGLSPLPAALLGAAITVAIAWPLDRWVEKPLRRPSAHRWRVGAGVAAAAALIALGIAAPTNASQDFLDDLADQNDLGSELTLPPASTSTVSDSVPDSVPDSSVPATTLPPPQLVGVFGDSLALTMALVLTNQVPRDVVPLSTVSTELGCGLVNSIAPERCRGVFDAWSAALAEKPADVAIVASCQWELVEREVPGVGTQHVGQPEMDALILAEYRAAASTLLEAGVDTIAWTSCAEFSPTVGFPPEPEFQAARDPLRTAALNRLIRQVAAESEGRIVVLDLAPWVDERRDDASLRPDGSHFQWEEPTPLADELVRLLDPILDRSN